MEPDEVILKYIRESKGPGRPKLLLEIIRVGSTCQTASFSTKAE